MVCKPRWPFKAVSLSASREVASLSLPSLALSLKVLVLPGVLLLLCRKTVFASLVPVVPDHSAQDSDSGHPAAPEISATALDSEESAAEPPSGDAASPSMEVDGSTTTEVPSEAGPAKHAREKASPEKTGKRVSAHPRGFSDSTLHDNDCKRRLLAWPSLMPSRNSSHFYEISGKT